MPTYCVSGIFFAGRAESAGETAEEQAFSEHLAQNVLRVHLAGPLFDDKGARIGWLLVIEAKSFEEAQAYLSKSPYYKLYQSTYTYEFRPEVGRTS